MILSTKCIRHYIGMFKMIFDSAIIITDDFHPSSLPQIQILLSEDMFKALVICEYATLFAVQIMSPDLYALSSRS